MNRFQIVVAEPLDFDRCLFSGQVFRWRKTADGYEGVDGPNWYRIHGDTVESTADRKAFESLFRLDWSDAPHRIAKLGPELHPLIEALPGLRLMRLCDPVEVFYTFLCTANNNLKRIVPMVEKLASYGECGRDARAPTFPRTVRIAEIPEQELRGKGFGYRAATITHAAREVLSRGGDDWIVGLREMPYDRAHEALVSIRGIGHKLADCICLYGLDHTDAVPIDTHMWQAACRVFFPEHAGMSLTESRYRQVADFMRNRFGSLAGWAHLYLYYGNMTRRTSALPGS